MRKLSELLFKKQPAAGLDAQALENYYAHGYLGNMYLSLGDLASAELEYSRAYTLLPSEEVKAKLDTVRRIRAARSRSLARPAPAVRVA
jgi:hypothetical protein